MIISKFIQLTAVRFPFREISNNPGNVIILKRLGTHYKSGAVKPKPHTAPLGFLGVMCAVIPGLFIGAAISKSVANFLEENELFVPSDDDDDDD